jgi:hypothetical protein
VQARGAFLSPTKVLRVMGPTQSAQLFMPPPRSAPARGALVRLSQVRGAGSRRPSWARRVARRQPPKPWGSAVSLGCRAPAAAPSNPRPGRGVGTRAGREGRKSQKGPPGPYGAPPHPGARSTHADSVARVRTCSPRLRCLGGL